jgi:hypothetical protein
MVIAVVALIAALAGTAFAGGFVTKKKVNKIITNRAPSLAVASAKSADTAKTADTAKNATTATTAANSEALGGKSLRGVQQWVHFFQGAIESQSGGITVTDLAAAGRQRVTFPTSVADCSINGNGSTQNPATDATNFANFMVMVGRSTTGANDVQVETVNDAGTAIDEPVFLTLNC